MVPFTYQPFVGGPARRRQCEQIPGGLRAHASSQMPGPAFQPLCWSPSHGWGESLVSVALQQSPYGSPSTGCHWALPRLPPWCHLRDP